MEKNEYLIKKESQLENILNDELFINFTNQLFAKKIKVKFKKTYNEDYLWRKALFLSTKGVLLLEENINNQTGIESVKKSAEIYENLYYTSKKFDKDYCLLLSSLCYDISGYQANAKCLIDQFENYYFLKDNTIKDNNSNDLIYFENKVLKSLQLFLQKKITQMNLDSDSNNFKESNNLSFSYNKTFTNFFKGINSLSNFILTGDESTALIDIDISHLSSFETGNVMLSHLIGLFETRLQLFKQRNIWDVLSHEKKIPHPIWDNYLKLLSNDIYDEIKGIKDENERTSIFEFWNSQLNAIKKGVISSEDNYVLKMPTSSGKTLIGELMILNSLIENPGSKCLYISPYNALSSEIEESIGNRLSKLGFKVSNAIGSYEIDEFQMHWIKDSDVLVATPEKIDLLYRILPEFFDNVSLIVIDEGHLIGETKNKRSTLLEFLIIKLRKKLHDQCRLLFISAVMTEKDAKDFSKWLNGNENNVIKSPIVYGNEWEPTRKLIGTYRWYEKQNSGEIKYYIPTKDKINTPFLANIIKENEYHIGRKKIKFPEKNNSNQTAVELAYKFIDEGNVLIFTARPDSAKQIGNKFLELLKLKENTNEAIKDQFKSRNLLSFEISKNSLGNNHEITNCLKRGIGIHFSSLPEPLKKAIEKDFREKRLDVLISTNTIAQGVNFPIKTIIVHNLIRDYRNFNSKISSRDFWNVVGRAGRAGTETEGQIIFLLIKPTDIKIFKEYRNKKNIPDLKNQLFEILKFLLKSRMSKNPFDPKLEKVDRALRYYFEPHLMNILMEEIVGHSDEDLINEMLGYSICKVKAESQEIDISPLANRFVKIGRKINSEVEDYYLRKLYSKTGFYITSCLKISEYIETNIEEFAQMILNKDSTFLLKKIMNIFPYINEMNYYKIEKSDIEENFDELFYFTTQWIEGNPISSLTLSWNQQFVGKHVLSKKMQLFINDYLEYRYPWGTRVFLDILIYHLNQKYSNLPKKYEDLPESIKLLPSFVKYGINSVVGCWSKTIGILTRDSCIKLAQNYNAEYEYSEFLNWASNLELDEINKLKLSEFETRNIISVYHNLNNEEINYNTIYRVEGIDMNESRRELSRFLNIGDILDLERDVSDEYDVYRTNLLLNKRELGFIPRNISQNLSLEIDLNDKKFEAVVIDKEEFEGFFEIFIQLNEIN